MKCIHTVANLENAGVIHSSQLFTSLFPLETKVKNSKICKLKTKKRNISVCKESKRCVFGKRRYKVSCILENKADSVKYVSPF